MSNPSQHIEDRYEIIGQYRKDQREYMEQNRIKGEPIETEVTNYALLCAIYRERKSLGERFQKVRENDEKVFRHYAEAAINAHVRAERKNCIAVLERAIGDRRITDVIAQEMGEQPYPVKEEIDPETSCPATSAEAIGWQLAKLQGLVARLIEERDELKRRVKANED